MAQSQADDTTPGDEHHTKADAASERQQCRLLELPAELRNKIYEYAVHQKVLQMPYYDCQPPLLFTCRQIRAEATPLYYYGNKFRIMLLDGHPRRLIKWTKQVSPYEGWRNGEYRYVPCETIFEGNVHWPNLMKLCRAVHNNRIDWYWSIETTSEHRFGSVVGAAMAITMACKRLRWSRCKAALQGLRIPASRWDMDWLDEDEDEFEAQELARYEVFGEDWEQHRNWTVDA